MLGLAREHHLPIAHLLARPRRRPREIALRLGDADEERAGVGAIRQELAVRGVVPEPRVGELPRLERPTVAREPRGQLARELQLERFVLGRPRRLDHRRPLEGVADPAGPAALAGATPGAVCGAVTAADPGAGLAGSSFFDGNSMFQLRMTASASPTASISRLPCSPSVLLLGRVRAPAARRHRIVSGVEEGVAAQHAPRREPGPDDHAARLHRLDRVLEHVGRYRQLGPRFSGESHRR